MALNDAEKRQVKEKPVKLWIDKLKDVSYDVEDVLDEWNTAILKSEIEKEGGSGRATHLGPPKILKNYFIVFILFTFLKM